MRTLSLIAFLCVIQVDARYIFFRQERAVSLHRLWHMQMTTKETFTNTCWFLPKFMLISDHISTQFRHDWLQELFPLCKDWYASTNLIMFFWVQCSSIFCSADSKFFHSQTWWFRVVCSHIRKSERMQVQIHTIFGLQRKFSAHKLKYVIISVWISSAYSLCGNAYMFYFCLFLLQVEGAPSWGHDFVVCHKLLGTTAVLLFKWWLSIFV